MGLGLQGQHLRKSRIGLAPPPSLHVGHALLPGGFCFGMELRYVAHGVQMKSEVDIVAARLPRFARND
jgi:hypothetical protein